MADFEKIVEKAVADEDIPGCVLLATNRDGSFKYAKAFGKRSMKSGGDQSPLQLSTIMWVASCTKLMTSICAMQLVERGLVTLDEPVYKYIPELKEFPVIKGFKEDGMPIEEPHKNPITLRLLLTHSAGFVYDGFHPSSEGWIKYHKKAPGSAGTVLERFSTPLIFEPGEQWMYGGNIDYVGLLIERVSNVSLEEFMKKNLWEPLGIKDMTFFLSKRPDLKARYADMSKRDPESGKAVYSDDRLLYQDADGNEVQSCMGGQGVFTSPEEYLKILHAVLMTEENEKILTKASVEEFFKPQLGEGSLATLNLIMQDDTMNNAMGGTPKEIKKDWGLGGVMLSGDVPGGPKEGTMIWGGMPNLIWWVDRKAGLCALYAGQLLPPGDSKCGALVHGFQDAIYEQYNGIRHA